MSPPRRTACFTSRTCIAASSRRATGCAKAATCAKWWSNTATISGSSRGRIWRLVHDTSKPGPQPAMYTETPAQLVAHLEHPNGWWRDTAQKLLVLKQDKSVVPALTAMARTNPNYLARLHALWTLEGLDAPRSGARPREAERHASAGPGDRHPRQRIALQEGRHSRSSRKSRR